MVFGDELKELILDVSYNDIDDDALSENIY